MGTARSEELLERIAIALEGIDRNLDVISSILGGIDDSISGINVLTDCVDSRKQFCVTGNVTNYTR